MCGRRGLVLVGFVCRTHQTKKKKYNENIEMWTVSKHESVKCNRVSYNSVVHIVTYICVC